MKAFILFFIFILELSATAQTIRIADNNTTRPTGANIYSTLQAAINAAASGDLVYVQPSPTSYGDVTIDKSITLRGIGFNTGKDIPLTSTVGSIVLTNTADNLSNASGSTIEGVAATNIYLGVQTGTFTYTIQNITISNCSINILGRQSSYMIAQNITVKNCSINWLAFANANVSQFLAYGNIFYAGLEFGAGNPLWSNGGGTLSSAIISNNIFTQTCYNVFLSTTISSLAIVNNLFMGGSDKNGSRFIGGQLTDAVVSNNIYYGATPGSSGGPFERNAFTNNISFGTSNDALPPTGTGTGNSGAGNQVNVDPKFVNAVYGVAYTSTMDFTLQSGSPAFHAGTDGTDIGITGGAYPFTSGNFALTSSRAPVIMQFNPAAIVPQNQPVKANIKAKSN